MVVEFRPPRLTVLDAEDRLVTYLAANPYAPSREGWPNGLGLDAKPVRTKALPGKLNSPAAVAVDDRGDLYLTKWLIGRLSPSFKR